MTMLTEPVSRQKKAGYLTFVGYPVFHRFKLETLLQPLSAFFCKSRRENHISLEVKYTARMNSPAIMAQME